MWPALTFNLAVTLSRCYFFPVSTITAKQLHQETKAVLNQLEQGESLVITRNGRTIGRIEPLTVPKSRGWADIMGEVWQAQKSVKATDRQPNSILQERQRRRR
jgi:antitoxin (DNA-binding transcriptional repressor) of toxin-antitoxin stability system